MKKLYFTGLVLLNLLNLLTSQAFCAKPAGQERQFCFYSKINTENNKMQFTLQSFKPITGYFAVGFGNSMKSAEVYVFWVNNNKVIAGRRSATGRREPQFIEEAQADFSLVPSLTKVGSEQTIITFERDMTVQSIPDVSATFKEDEKLTSMIWAVGNLGFSSDDPSNSIPIHQRDNKGQVSVNLFDKVNSPYIEGSSPRSGNLEGQGEGSSSSSTLIIMHGVFMFLAWCVFAPTGIFVARFFKDILGENWFKLHIGLMLGGGSLLSVVALIIAVVATGGIDVSDMEALGTSHVVLGLIVIIVSIAQVVSGFVIDKLFDPARNKIPWWDKMHWYVGRFLALFGWINVALGIKLYAGDTNLSTILLVSFFIWFLVIIGFTLIFTKKFGQVHHGSGFKKNEGDDLLNKNNAAYEMME